MENSDRSGNRSNSQFLRSDQQNLSSAEEEFWDHGTHRRDHIGLRRVEPKARLEIHISSEVAWK